MSTAALFSPLQEVGPERVLLSYAKDFDGRIDDPNAGWKGRGLWSTDGDRTPWLSDSPRREWTANNFEGFLRSLVAIAGIRGR